MRLRVKVRWTSGATVIVPLDQLPLVLKTGPGEVAQVRTTLPTSLWLRLTSSRHEPPEPAPAPRCVP